MRYFKIKVWRMIIQLLIRILELFQSPKWTTGMWIREHLTCFSGLFLKLTRPFLACNEDEEKDWRKNTAWLLEQDIIRLGPLISATGTEIRGPTLLVILTCPFKMTTWLPWIQFPFYNLIFYAGHQQIGEDSQINEHKFGKSSFVLTISNIIPSLWRDELNQWNPI